MSALPSMMQTHKFVRLSTLAADAAGRDTAYVNVKNCSKIYLIAGLVQGVATPVTISPIQAQDRAATGVKLLANNVQIYLNNNAAVTDVFTRQADGVSFTTDATLATKEVVFEINVSEMDVNNGFDCIALRFGASSASNSDECRAVLAGLRYQEDPPPTAFVN